MPQEGSMSEFWIEETDATLFGSQILTERSKNNLGSLTLFIIKIQANFGIITLEVSQINKTKTYIFKPLETDDFWNCDWWIGSCWFI